jgi:hypothetical protein
MNIYIDGFNVYYGCLKGTPYKWLDVGALCSRLFPRDRINRIRYFGFAERLRREQGIPVSVHEMDADLARGDVPNPSKGFGPTKLGPLLGFLWFTILRGGLRTPKLTEVATFGTVRPWMCRGARVSS